MARVNVDSQAVTDARFAILATLMGSDDPDLALGRMIRVWLQCYERGTYVLTKSVIVALFRGQADAPRWLVEAELAEEVEGGLRIRGTKGRIEYMMQRRATARENGSLGGRPPGSGREPTSVSGRKPTGLQDETPPAPALPPALPPALVPPLPPATGGTDEPTTPAVALPPELDTEEFRRVWGEWKAERAAKRHRPYTPRGESQQLKKLAKYGPRVAIAAIEEATGQGWQGLFPEKIRDTASVRPGHGVGRVGRAPAAPGKYDHLDAAGPPQVGGPPGAVAGGAAGPGS